MAEASPVGIELRRLSAEFRHHARGLVAAVRQVDLAVAPGELLTLLGPSGCGKTTTLRMIAGFQEPSAGEIVIGGRDVTRLPANRRNIGFVFQNYALFPHLSVFENVAYGLRVQHEEDAALCRRVGEVLALVGLAEHGARSPSELSGGQQQRVALARAIVINPRVLLFDEPLSNLDANLRIQMRDEIRRLQKTLGITTVYVTHDQEEAMAISDRIAVMADGRLAQLGTAEELYRRPASAFVAGFLGRANLLAATAERAADGAVALAFDGFAHTVRGAGNAAPAGARVRAVIRPEAIAIGPPGGGLSGTVVAATYLGDKIEYVVRVGAHELQVERFNPPEAERFAAGGAVSVHLPEQGVQIIVEEAE